MSGRELFTVKRLESLRNQQENDDYGKLFGEQAYAGRFTDFGGSHGATGESPVAGERVVARKPEASHGDCEAHPAGRIG
jgi:hypothetical protein